MGTEKIEQQLTDAEQAAEWACTALEDHRYALAEALVKIARQAAAARHRTVDVPMFGATRAEHQRADLPVRMDRIAERAEQALTELFPRLDPPAGFPPVDRCSATREDTLTDGPGRVCDQPVFWRTHEGLTELAHINRAFDLDHRPIATV